MANDHKRFAAREVEKLIAATMDNRNETRNRRSLPPMFATAFEFPNKKRQSVFDVL